MEGGVERVDDSEVTVVNDMIDSRLRHHNFEGDNDNSDREGLSEFVDIDKIRFQDNLSELTERRHFLLRVLGGFETVELDMESCCYGDILDTSFEKDGEGYHVRL